MTVVEFQPRPFESDSDLPTADAAAQSQELLSDYTDQESTGTVHILHGTVEYRVIKTDQDFIDSRNRFLAGASEDLEQDGTTQTDSIAL